MIASTQDLFLERQERIQSITGTKTWAVNLPYNCDKIIQSVHDYIDQCCKLTNVSLCDLPNITPNGLILPKIEVMNEYNRVHQNIGELIQSFLCHIKYIHSPVNIRIVRNNKNNRPRSSLKWHSDIWANEPTNAIMMFIPISGLENIDIIFKEPHESFYPNHIKEFKDYNECVDLISVSPNINFELKYNNIAIMDPFILHQTRVKQNGYRISIDFRFIPQIQCKSDLYLNTIRYKNYYNAENWFKPLKTNKSIFDTYDHLQGYAQEYYV